MVKKAAALGYKNVRNDPQQMAGALKASGRHDVLRWAQELHQVQTHPSYLDARHPDHNRAVDLAMEYQEALARAREEFLGEQ